MTKDIQMDQTWLMIRMTPAEYAGLTGHSEGYVRKFIAKGADLVEIRVPTAEVLEDIYDVKRVKGADRHE